jgi:cyclophilin family peptidyl-prolyl cis-trans isomerase
MRDVSSSPARTSSGKPDTPATPAGSKVPRRDALHQSFTDATRAADNPPADVNRPPDETVTKKPVHKLLADLQARWDTIHFTSADGRKIEYSVTLHTAQGDIQIALFPDLAPNHVRNFLALCEAGYYDGLFFDRARTEEGDAASSVLRTIEAGCPLGTGEPGNGSIGYWLKPEFQPGTKVSHDEGTVGACRGDEPDSAACRFYINLEKAPFLDGNYTIFGKVVQGLDVARKIYVQPVIIDDQDRDGARRPERPVVIHKVTVHKLQTEAKR